VDVIAWLEFPLIEPDAHPVGLEPIRDRTRHRLIFRAVAQENIGTRNARS
jgi:hypothetical protein